MALRCSEAVPRIDPDPRNDPDPHPAFDDGPDRHSSEPDHGLVVSLSETRARVRRIVGVSAAIQQVLRQVELVAPTDASVLIHGESGTGKELVARALYERSPRRRRPFVCVNCAAIPRDLFESEFFGHVKGSFTGALTQRVGRFEAADTGTLLLDEISEMPLELQPKLLRVLQESEFERIGEHRARSVDVRVISTTNRDLVHEVQRQRFRQDLYFRLNVFPIEVPPLRDRPEDIPALAAHFLRRESRKLQRPEPRLTSADIMTLQRYGWPGNIRELENVVERAVILSPGDRLVLPDLAEMATPFRMARPLTANTIKTEDQRKQEDRANIAAAIQKTNGKIGGADGAAAMLGLKPTTLRSRMKALGIDVQKGNEPVTAPPHAIDRKPNMTGIDPHA